MAETGQIIIRLPKWIPSSVWKIFGASITMAILFGLGTVWQGYRNWENRDAIVQEEKAAQRERDSIQDSRIAIADETAIRAEKIALENGEAIQEVYDTMNFKMNDMKSSIDVMNGILAEKGKNDILMRKSIEEIYKILIKKQ